MTLTNAPQPKAVTAFAAARRGTLASTARHAAIVVMDATPWLDGNASATSAVATARPSRPLGSTPT